MEVVASFYVYARHTRQRAKSMCLRENTPQPMTTLAKRKKAAANRTRISSAAAASKASRAMESHFRSWTGHRAMAYLARSGG